MNTQRKSSIMMFLYYFIFVTIAFFMAPFLTNNGVDQVTVGYLQMTGLILLIISLLISGYLTDNFISNKNLMKIYLALSIAAMIIFLLNISTILLCISFLLIWFFFMPLTSIIDGLVLIDLDKKQYAKVRSYGSLGAAISYFISSIFLGQGAFDALIFINIILLIVLLSFAFNISEKAHIDRVQYKEGIKSIMSNRNLILIMIITFLTYGVLAADDAYSYNFASEVVGISASIIGLMGLMSILLEASVMNLYLKINHIISTKNLLYLSSVSLLFVFVVNHSFYTNVNLVILASIVLGLFVGLFVPISISIIRENSDPSIVNSVLSIYQMAIKFGGIILGFATTYLLSVTGDLPSIYLLHAIVIMFSFIFIFLLKLKKVEKN